MFMNITFSDIVAKSNSTCYFVYIHVRKRQHTCKTNQFILFVYIQCKAELDNLCIH